jgi:hypothetical protein
MGLTSEEACFDSVQDQKIFFGGIRPNLGPTQPATPWVPEGLSRGVNQPRREDDD